MDSRRTSHWHERIRHQGPRVVIKSGAETRDQSARHNRERDEQQEAYCAAAKRNRRRRHRRRSLDEIGDQPNQVSKNQKRHR